MDPFYLVQAYALVTFREIDNKINGLENGTLPKSDESFIEEIKSELEELTQTIEVAEHNPFRFKISSEELLNRRKYVEKSRQRLIVKT